MNSLTAAKTILPLLALALTPLRAQSPVSQSAPVCGKVPVHLDHPEYLATSRGIVIVQTPKDWVRAKSDGPPFYFVKQGESYNNARTLMYINLELLKTSLRRAVENDNTSFRRSCPEPAIKNLRPADLLEMGCERMTTQFSCKKERGSYVDVDTKIAIGDLLLNVVLSSDSSEEISKYTDDYHYLLMHLTLVGGADIER